MKRKILLLGGGGHCKSVLDSLYDLNKYDDIGIVDIKENVGKKILNTRVLGTDEDLQILFDQGYKDAFITVGSIGDTTLREKLTRVAENIGFKLTTIIDPTSSVSKYTEVGTGVFVGKQAVINAGSKVGNGAIINSCAIVEHDCEIGSYVHISPGTVICGEVSIGDHTHIGANTVVKQQVEIGRKTTIGMGSIVLKNIKSNIIAYGNPCREVR